MRIYRAVIRVLVGVTFVLGGVHLILGQTSPGAYAAFADTTLLPWLADLWRGFGMDNIGWLTISLAGYEIACGLGLAFRPTLRPAAWGILAFLVFITVVGYGYPTASPLEDVLKNRLATAVLALLVLPLTFRSPRA
ncbi:DoxX family membrane protein [Corynebacterium guangdongense]|uniref:Membrane protein YphA (DoxX/SURF4 family) n=1 Tax=Corynebacterium guangdongense TaxID=1783348 RepID=A0ABU1ZXH6_9CORY|nr:DoxX family membrane protein [Corynebacterium guangdongense]MDR7329621.1 putative membrane protein YphA (DoxX/SURF4 family) [Corynebacterium guangdongense]WJZ18186.1 DoxX [Corynebacterium guangdongense]